MAQELAILQPYLGKTSGEFCLDPDVSLWLKFKLLCLEDATLLARAAEAPFADAGAYKVFLSEQLKFSAVLPPRFRPKTNKRNFHYALGQFYAFHEALVSKASPIMAVHEATGLGLAIRHGAHVARKNRPFLGDFLHGELFAISQPLYERLKERNYPALFVAKV